MKKHFFWLAAIVLSVGLVLSACGTQDNAAIPQVGQQEDGQQNSGQDSQLTGAENNQPGEDVQPAQGIEPSSELDSGIPAERQQVEIQTADGRVLEGYYYPAKFADAPVVVLMHWAPGSMQDWETLALWLQNRPDEIAAPQDGSRPFHDASWFPEMPEDNSFAVLIFNFGDYGASQYGGSRDSLVEDARASLEYAASLPSGNSHQVASIGASIGADGVVDGCYLFNDGGEMGTCIGALSLSPGNYLTDEFSYAFAAEMINLSGYPVWCLAAENDGASPDLCASLPGDFNQSFIFSGRHHGMELIDPELSPVGPNLELNALEIIQEFLEGV
ncbi:MAG: hypothetical protein GWN30_01765, partial [Gammaproteobacteria bacterium]|nr:hypothetical protein [Gammaproteobacteria bacterium]